jgi:hypothetical protein
LKHPSPHLSWSVRSSANERDTMALAQERVFECDRCECTMICTLNDLVKRHRWLRWADMDKPYELLLCPDCKPKPKPEPSVKPKAKAA